MKIISWDANNINDKTNYDSVIMAPGFGLSRVRARIALRHGSQPIISSIERPGKLLYIHIIINGSPIATLQKQLNQWFDPDDETRKQLLVEDDVGGANDRRVWGICEQLSLLGTSGIEWVATVRLDDDIMWRELTATVSSPWSVTASGQTKVVTNNGEMDAYPILKIKPTSAKTGGYPYKRFIVVEWKVIYQAISNYPVDIVNNGLDTRIASTNFAQADGDDLRVLVDGSEVDRYLDGPDTSTTKVFVNLDFQNDIPMTLDGALGTGDTTITVSEDITNMPSAGIIKIDSEIITYTSKNNSSKTFTNCSRGTKGSTAATHTDTTAVKWLQHDIWIIYGNAAAGAGPASSDTEPMFERSTSSNTSWDFNDFGRTGTNRTAQWAFEQRTGSAVGYTGNRWSSAEPWEEVGVRVRFLDDAGIFFIGNICGILSANFVNGEQYSENAPFVAGEIESSNNYGGGGWNTEYDIPGPSADDTWESWSRNETLDTGRRSVGLYSFGFGSWTAYIEVADVTIALNTANTPAVSIGAEQGNYSLTCTITNQTTGDAVTLDFIMDLNEQLELDTDDKTVIYLDDSTNQFQALGLVGGSRRDWLKLRPGTNTIRFDDTGTNAVTVDFTHTERFYQ